MSICVSFISRLFDAMINRWRWLRVLRALSKLHAMTYYPLLPTKRYIFVKENALGQREIPQSGHPFGLPIPIRTRFVNNTDDGCS